MNKGEREIMLEALETFEEFQNRIAEGQSVDHDACDAAKAMRKRKIARHLIKALGGESASFARDLRRAQAGLDLVFGREGEGKPTA